MERHRERLESWKAMLEPIEDRKICHYTIVRPGDRTVLRVGRFAVQTGR